MAIIHRPRYDDWSFPKGHLEPGETWEQAACREVAEETGFSGDLGSELRTSRYEDRHGRPKVVRWWGMRVTSGTFTPNNEVDEVLWETPAGAVVSLTYDDDRELVHQLVADTTT